VPAFTSAPYDDLQARPTRVRYAVVAVAVLMAILLYLDRYCVSFAERYIKEDLRLTESQTAWFLSLFFWSYALGQVPCGWLGDRFGVRGVLALYILAWSLFTALIGVAGGIVSLLVMRLGCGLAQAGAFPACGNLLSKWIPLSSRGKASALVALGGRMGGAIAPILTAYLMVVFVPLSTPALLETGQLLHPERLSVRLSASDEKAGLAEQRIRELWPADHRLNSAPAHPNGDENIVAGLNELLRRPDLFRDQDVAPLKSIEREALNLLAKRASGVSLSEEQAIRLNRLVLEAVFPTEIGKLYVRGWRPVVIVYGLTGIVVAALFWLFFRSTPAEHPWCNAAERALIDVGKDPAAVTHAAEALPLVTMLRSGSLWLSSISQFTTNFAWLFLVTFLARYLVEVHQVPILERSWMAAVPPMAGIAGMFVGGQLTDWLTRRIGLRWGRALPMGITRFLAAAAYLACLWLDSPWAATIAFACVFFSVDLGVSAVWAFAQDVGGKHVGSILGWGNMWGNIGAAIAPQVYNYVLGERPTIVQWNTMFVVCAGMFVLSGISALGINATVPIEAAREESASA
jgi:MFS transporter, ACS family, glucarate transporter